MGWAILHDSHDSASAETSQSILLLSYITPAELWNEALEEHEGGNRDVMRAPG